MLERISRFILTLLLCIIIAFPLFYCISMSFFTNIDFTDAYAHFLPSHPVLDNFRTALQNRYYPRFIINSLLTSALTAIGRTLITVMAAFAFTHIRFRFRQILLISLLGTMFIPPDALLYPNYRTIAELGLIDTYAAIILPSLFSASALLLMISSFVSAGQEYYDAARIDGAKDSVYIAKILCPMAGSVVFALFLQAFISSFNSYLWPLLVTNRNSMRTVQVGITMLGFADGGEYGAQFAAITIIVLPFLIILGFGRKRLSEYLSGEIRL